MKGAARWLRTLARAGKAQRGLADSVCKQLLAQPKAAKSKTSAKTSSKASPKVSSPKTAVPVRTSVRVADKSARAAFAPRAPRSLNTPLPGKWLAAQIASTSPSTPAILPGQGMSYWLYWPDKEASAAMRKRGRPLVVMLHGCQQTATQFAQGTRMNRRAERKGFAVLYPQQSLSGHAQRCWKWYDKATQQGGGDVRAIVEIIRQVAARYPVDRSRIYIGGISAGAAMAHIVALNHPELIAALGLHSGPVFGAGHHPMAALNVMQHGAALRADDAIAEILLRQPAFPAMPTILIHGDGDAVVRPVNQSQLLRQSVLLNRLPKGAETAVQHVAGGSPRSRAPANAYQLRDFYDGDKLMLRVAQIDQLGHAWSGGDASLQFNAKAGPDSSKMMLDFFAQHRRGR